MTHREAMLKLLQAGLHVRTTGQTGENIIGGSYVDRSGSLNEVHGSYLIRRVAPDAYTVAFSEVASQPMPLDEAVALVIKAIPPGTDIEAPLQPDSKGVVNY